MERHVAGLEARGKLTTADVDQASKVGERYHRALEREALTLRSRLEAVSQAQALDLAGAMAHDADLEERERELAEREAALLEREELLAGGLAIDGHAEEVGDDG